LVDLFFVGALLLKTYRVSASATHGIRYGTYAALLFFITVQELAQYGAWQSGHLLTTDEPRARCAGSDIFFSLLATGSALLVPVVPMISAAATPSPTKANRLLRTAFGSWLALLTIVVACVVHTRTYCIELGKNHHQVWICASAVYRTGGYPLFSLAMLLYIVSGLYALFAVPTIPPIERWWICGIGLTTAAVSFGIYGRTLEACSIWCWSAFILGLYFGFLCLTQ
jgi:hypothetical protein